MVCDFGSIFFTSFAIVIFAVYCLLKRANDLFYTSKFSSKEYNIPPGDMSLPFIGNMFTFFTTFKYGDPESFISYFTSRYGQGGMYKAFMFGTPSIIVTKPQVCKKILMDDDNFELGWPKSVLNLIGKKALHGITSQEHKRLRRITTSPIKGKHALSLYLGLIEEVVKSSFEKWNAIEEKPIEFLSEMKKSTFEVIIRIMIGSEIDPQWLDMVEKVYTIYLKGFLALPINLPGFAYHRAFKARENLVKIFQSVIDERKVMNMKDESRSKGNMVDLIMAIEDDEGRRLNDEEIIDLLIVYVFAGHETTAHTAAWAIMYLEQHPEFLQKAKEEQEEIVKRRHPDSDKKLSYDEIRQMKYLTKVIDETLRCSNVTLAIYRNAKRTINMNGYTIPKGWKVLTWIRQVNLDPNNHVNSKEFNPSRWDTFSAFLPFGAGPRLCPGAELAKLEVSVFLHYFLLNYRLERLNPKTSVTYLPIPSPTDNCLARLKRISSSCQ
ncbi:hypothetical protein H5410_039489 [Solanum commersonii]|uniref:Uncharacterized protein n=1 Tax=Solanum commersonii TaxID=4109 RepID=A0A9J5XNC0_SOLCO|nr:hypothetical protein H5410_039489 [Solanum commersonii]